MSIALVGVIIIQFLWIKNALQMKQEQCDHSVNAALVRVSATLENKYGVHWITKKLSADSSVRKEVMKEDPGFYKFMISVGDGQEQQDPAEPASNEMEERVITTINGDTISTLTNQADFNDHQNKLIKVVQLRRIKEPPMVKQCIMQDAEEPAMPPRAGKLISIVKNAANEWAMSKMSAKDLSDALDSGEIRSVIEKEFQREGLHDNFEFATYCMAGDSLIINKAASSNPLHDFAFHAPLIATDFIDGGTMLLVNFPQHFKYMFASIAGMLTLSLLFTLSLIITFVYSLLVIFKQKKISDITNDFINNMTHELKTPLATISMTADTLALASVNQNTGLVTEYSGMIKKEVKKLSQHVDRILETALLERNGPGSKNDLIDIVQLVQDEVKVFGPLIEQRNGLLNFNCNTGDFFVKGNKSLLQSAVSNLIDNAIKYSPDSPQITIGLTRLEGKLLLSVRDKGIGIHKADQKLIFEKFYRAPTGNRHDVKGFGLGLSFVKEVVENLKGKVWAESEFGKGSAFFIEVPLN